MDYNFEPTSFHSNHPELVIMVGPPGSGKSTYAKLNYPWHTIISQDDMGRHGHWESFRHCVEHGAEIVIDRMNFNHKQRLRYIAPAVLAGYRVSMVLFAINQTICLQRMKNRKRHPTLNDPAKYQEVLNFFARNYEQPTVSEFSKLEVIR